MAYNMRGFNFIEDYAKALPYRTDGVRYSDKDVLDQMKFFAGAKKAYESTFDNCELEMKRFIAWFYIAEHHRYDAMVDADESGFLKECISLYDPKTNKYKTPMGCFDYSCDFS